MFKIKVIVPITNWNIDVGYFTGCYRVRDTDTGGTITWIGYTNRNGEEHLHKIFKTRKSAENKIKFLQEKQQYNGYMQNWNFEIDEV